MQRMHLWGVVVLAAVVVGGCSQGPGPGSDYVPEKPARPGDVESLCAHAWKHENGVFIFYPQGQLQFQPPIEGTQPFHGTYALQEGILDITVMGLPPLKGTWDGTTLVIDGQTCKPRDKQGQ